MVRNPRGPSPDAARVRSRASGRRTQPFHWPETLEDRSKTPGTAHGTGEAECDSRDFHSYPDRRPRTRQGDREKDRPRLPGRAQEGDPRLAKESRVRRVLQPFTCFYRILYNIKYL